MKQVIFTADDFGASLSVNEAVELAATSGVLTAASLMVTGVATPDAVQRARRLPRLRVGLHVVLADGRPALPAADVPDLVTPDGKFRDNLFHAGVRFFFLPRVRRQLLAEVQAQFERFRATGLELDHVNTHKHLHFHPTVLDALLRVGTAFGMRAIRLPLEYPPGWLLRPWLALLQRRVRAAGLLHNDFVFGLRHSGRMDEATVLDLLARCPDGVSEFYFHVATRAGDGSYPAHYACMDELQALLSNRVAAAVRAAGLRCISFRDLEAA